MKKTNKPNPLKVFNDNKAMAYKKAGGEMAAYKKSLKKFQGEGDSEVNMMINKPGSTGGYKNSRSIFSPPAGMNAAALAQEMSKSASSSRNNVDIANQQALNARSAATQGSVIKPSVDRIRPAYEEPRREMGMINSMYPTPSKSSNTVKGVVAGEPAEYTYEQLKAMGIQKRGGAVKTKKRK